jgi:predicted RNA binding protein YcfA (HicA-like mRNA interferase family)
MPRQFDVVIERDAEGYYVASVPQVPGCHTQARSLDEINERVREAIRVVPRGRRRTGSAFGVCWHPARDYCGMSRTPRVTGTDLIAAPGKAGFSVRRVKGSHHFVRHEDGRSTAVPVHSGETIGPGLLHKILPGLPTDSRPTRGTALSVYSP